MKLKWFWFGFLPLLLAGFLLYLPPELGISLVIPPDSSEYSISLANLFKYGRFGFTLNGEWYPSRYVPWFSLTCLWPAYLLFAGNVLYYHLAILVFALGTLALVTKWAQMAGLTSWRAYVPAVFLMLLPDFVFYSRVVMTETPYTCLFAASAILFVRMASAPQLSLVKCLGAGALVTWCGMVRGSALPLLLPFAVLTFLKCSTWNRRIRDGLLLALPACAYEMVNLTYNFHVFGSPLRGGYNFWVPIPFDFPELLFNWSYVKLALSNLPLEPVMLITGIGFVITLIFISFVAHGYFGGFRAHRRFLLLFVYLSFHAIVLFSLYLGYYWCDTRFYLTLTICILPLSIAALSHMLRSRHIHHPNCILAMLLILYALYTMQAPTRYSFMTAGRPIWIQEAQMTANVLPPNSVVIQAGDPSVMDYFGFSEKKITVLPFLREFDYVNYMTAPTSIGNFRFTETDYRKRIIPELIKSGVCKLPFPLIFAERPNVILDYLAAGRRVFLHEGGSTCPEWLDFAKKEATRMNLSLIHYQTWQSPPVVANPVRHVYDKFIFPSFTMDARCEVNSRYYEFVRKQEKQPLVK